MIELFVYAVEREGKIAFQQNFCSSSFALSSVEKAEDHPILLPQKKKKKKA